VKGWSRQGAKRLVATVSAGQLRFGQNQVRIQLVKQSAKSAAARTVTAFELHVDRRVQ
jgi:hypothetical protein